MPSWHTRRRQTRPEIEPQWSLIPSLLPFVIKIPLFALFTISVGEKVKLRICLSYQQSPVQKIWKHFNTSVIFPHDHCVTGNLSFFLSLCYAAAALHTMFGTFCTGAPSISDIFIHHLKFECLYYAIVQNISVENVKASDVLLWMVRKNIMSSRTQVTA